VDFPVDGLDVQKYVKMDCKEAGVSSTYDLFGVVNHFGSLNGGHYTATCKNSLDGNWYYFNDSSVSGAAGRKFMSDAAYILFYRRRDDASSNVSTTATQDAEGQSLDEEYQNDTSKTAGIFSTGLEEEKTDTDINKGTQMHYSEEDEFLNELD
jgi:hypothetical protein